MRAGERKIFELDARERGNFQHDVLQVFHERIQAEHRRWRDLTPAEAREKIAGIAQELMPGYHDGLFRESARTLFAAQSMAAALQDFVETIVTWLRNQYEFDPALAEAVFDSRPGAPLPAWNLPLGPDLPGLKLSLHGRIDRVDFWRDPAGETALAVVMDYKSSGKKLDPLLIENGVQLQLLAYLNVLRHWSNPPRGRACAGSPRRRFLYQSPRLLRQRRHPRRSPVPGRPGPPPGLPPHRPLRRRPPAPARPRPGDGPVQIPAQARRQPHQGSAEALPPEQFLALLDGVETRLIAMGRRLFAGAAAVDPYRKGAATACDYCDYAPICRIDPWTHPYRRLQAAD